MKTKEKHEKFWEDDKAMSEREEKKGVCKVKEDYDRVWNTGEDEVMMLAFKNLPRDFVTVWELGIIRSKWKKPLRENEKELYFCINSLKPSPWI